MKPEYEVWASNDPSDWTHCIAKTNDREEAKARAQQLIDAHKFRFVAIDRFGKTIWSNDPATPAVTD